MPRIEVLLEVPTAIDRGLVSGHLERVGGVVRNASSKEIVAWLREGGQIANNPNLPNGLLGTLMQKGGAINPIMSVVDLAFKVGSQVAIMNMLKNIGALVMFNGAIGLLNVTIGAANLVAMSRYVRKLQEQLNLVAAQVNAGFANLFAAKLDAGLKAANNAQFASGKNIRFFAQNAIQDLDFVQAEINRRIDEMKPNDDQEIFHLLLSQAFQIHVVLLRCHLRIDSYETAMIQKEALSKYEERTRETIKKFLNLNRGIYFHKSVDEDDLWRYVRLRQWLVGESEEDMHKALAKLVLEERQYFWDQNVINPKASLPSPFAKIKGMVDGNVVRTGHMEALDKAEALMFSYCHLESLHREIEAVSRIGIPYSEWQKQQEEAIKKRLAEKDTDIEEYDDYVLLVDRDSLDAIA